MSVNQRLEGKAMIAELHNPPVNAIGQAIRQGLLEAVLVAEQLGVERVVLTGSGRAFAAGADAREFDGPPLEPHLPDVLARIEDSPVPWIAAINGLALGGGAELAMACRMRIMLPGAQIGLPEVTLGVIPGAGGTLRLPRLVGLAKALEMIASGRAISAEEAHKVGLVHGLDSDPLAAARDVPIEDLTACTKVRSLDPPSPDPAAIETAQSRAETKMRGQIAPLKAIQCVADGLMRSFDDALTNERATFLELRDGLQARALRHAFFAQRGAKPPKDTAEVPDIDHVAVVGGGTMGAGISYALLQAGLRVSLLEADQERVAQAESNVEQIVKASQTRGLISELDAAAQRRRLSIGTDYEAAAGAGLAIEAAFEDMSVKRAVFAQLQAALRPTAVLASNTSYLDINEIAGDLADPSRVLGLHFFAPAHIMKLLEIVRGDATSDAALAVGYQIAKKLRKSPVVAGVCDGFIGNRIFSRYREAADTLLMDGALPQDIDAAMRGFGYAMGPYETQDLSGLDIGYANRRRQDATRDPRRRYIPIADRLVEAGRLGRKTGAGWYRYRDGAKEIDPRVEEIILTTSTENGVTRRNYTHAEIRDRLLLAMISEAIAILEEGIAQSAADIDLVSLFGYGFPRWRGGLLHYADTLGAEAILTEIKALSIEDPIAWTPPELLVRAVKQNQRLSEMRPCKS